VPRILRRTPASTLVVLTLGLAVVGITIPLSSAAGQQRRMPQPATTPVRYRPDRTPLSMPERVTMLTQLTGTALNATALASPVRLTVSHPNHLDRVFVRTYYVVAFPSIPESAADDYWDLRQVTQFETAMIQLNAGRGVAIRPVLVDCLVSGQLTGQTDSRPQLTVDTQASDGSFLTQVVDVPAQAGHLMTVMWPPPPAVYQGSVRIRLTHANTSVRIHYCEMTEPK
jgi:hypothetical protein